MARVEKSIEIEKPLRMVYDQWTQFEEFPSFMEGVESVTQVDDTHLHWVAEFGGAHRGWDAVVTEQHPDERVAWTSTTGTSNAGVVTFHKLDDTRTRVMLQLDVDPEGFVEHAGDALGFIRRRASGDLGRFKDLIESRGASGGGWRGEVSADSPSNMLNQHQGDIS
jgi:uncharacterized membrane protein